MKLRLLLIFIFALIAWKADAAPFLVCDPYPPTAPAPTQFLLTIDAAAEITVLAADAPSSAGKYLRYDLAAVPFGRHRVTVKAQNATTTSPPSSPFMFDVGLASPTGITVMP